MRSGKSLNTAKFRGIKFFRFVAGLGHCKEFEPTPDRYSQPRKVGKLAVAAFVLLNDAPIRIFLEIFVAFARRVPLHQCLGIKQEGLAQGDAMYRQQVNADTHG